MVTHLFMQNKSWMQIFKWPLAICLLTTYGLVVALIEDGGNWELLSILALSTPVAVMIYFYWIK